MLKIVGQVLVVGLLFCTSSKAQEASKPKWYDGLIAAIRSDNSNAVAQIFSTNALATDVALNANASTALMVASSLGARDVVKWLLTQGADVKASTVLRDPEKPPGVAGFTALHFACGRNQVEIAGLLIERGAVIGQKDEDGNSPFVFACAKGHLEVVKFLLTSGAKIEELNGYGWTPLLVVVSKKQTKVAEYLIAQGANVNSKYPNGRTALMTAAEQGDELLAQLLIEKGADVNQLSDSHGTALIDAAVEGQAKVAKLLIQNNAKIDQRNQEGWSALMKAVAHGHCETVKILCEAGANPSFTNNFSHTAFDYARGLTGTNVLTKDINLSPLIENGSISRDDLYYVMARLSGDGDYDCVLKVLEEYQKRVRGNPAGK